MAPPKYTPDKTTFERWLAEDPPPTHQQMADRVFDQTGHRVTRAAISVALMSYGLTTPKHRYEDTLPWRVAVEHGRAYPARCLRLLGKRRRNLPLTPQEETLLNNWLADLDRDELIVAYDPGDDQGFHYISKTYKDHDEDIPIRRKTLNLSGT